MWNIDMTNTGYILKHIPFYYLPYLQWHTCHAYATNQDPNIANLASALFKQLIFLLLSPSPFTFCILKDFDVYLILIFWLNGLKVGYLLKQLRYSNEWLPILPLAYGEQEGAQTSENDVPWEIEEISWDLDLLQNRDQTYPEERICSDSRR